MYGLEAVYSKPCWVSYSSKTICLQKVLTSGKYEDRVRNVYPVNEGIPAVRPLYARPVSRSRLPFIEFCSGWHVMFGV